MCLPFYVNHEPNLSYFSLNSVLYFIESKFTDDLMSVLNGSFVVILPVSDTLICQMAWSEKSGNSPKYMFKFEIL